ncbi:MAG TPA: nucleotide-binding protein [Fimbriimonadaceae bacterium]|nr:nucleotide-binding protein [Fimbriimonadaceae bacterium]
MRTHYSSLQASDEPGLYLAPGVGLVQVDDLLLETAKAYGGNVDFELADVTPMDSSMPVFVAMTAIPTGQVKPNTNKDPRNVFVIHGRDLKAYAELRDFLRALDLKPIEWSQARVLTGQATPFTWEIVEAAFSKAAAIVALFTGDDEARLTERLRNNTPDEAESELQPQPRPNVIFEAGVAFGRHPESTIFVAKEKLRSLSDLDGRNFVYINDSIESKQELAQRLQSAGCAVDMHGADWHRANRFSPAPAKTTNAPGAHAAPVAPEPRVVLTLKGSAGATVRPKVVQVEVKPTRRQPDPLFSLMVPKAAEYESRTQDFVDVEFWISNEGAAIARGVAVEIIVPPTLVMKRVLPQQGVSISVDPKLGRAVLAVTTLGHGMEPKCVHLLFGYKALHEDLELQWTAKADNMAPRNGVLCLRVLPPSKTVI